MINQNTYRSGSIILAFPLFIAGLLFTLMGIWGIVELSESSFGADSNSSLLEGLLVILLCSMIGLMSVIGAYRLATKKESIFPKWFIVVFSVLFTFGMIWMIVTTKNFTWIALIIGILIYNYKIFFKNRNKNHVISTNKYFR